MVAGHARDLPLGLEDLHPPAELGELGPLLGLEWRPRRSLAGQGDPAAETLVRDAQVHRHLADRLSGRLGEPDGLGAELGAVVGVLLPHLDSFPRTLPRW